ncbi:hypothetical protein [Trichormus azollae]|jgi:hypothetical protein|uniref:Uncharacterized protein n=1 Tax=Nostoc azollae (strain 0708) TaxID=551115 RepID=D7DWD5_NOSA0|nr:hypothetical protein [Trichormus azollae]ADI64052.1 hypothetical protein Aazo_1974 ['Nostoc azollae' 0708]
MASATLRYQYDISPSFTRLQSTSQTIYIIIASSCGQVPVRNINANVNLRDILIAWHKRSHRVPASSTGLTLGKKMNLCVNLVYKVVPAGVPTYLVAVGNKQKNILVV